MHVHFLNDQKSSTNKYYKLLFNFSLKKLFNIVISGIVNSFYSSDYIKFMVIDYRV